MNRMNDVYEKETVKKWFPFLTYKREENTSIPIVICFHHAGGSAAYYRNWTMKKLGINFACAEFPGKGTRIKEEFLNDFEEIKPMLCEAVKMLVGDSPYIIFGHSMGAAIGFYVSHYMEKVYERAPQKLIVAGRQAPDIEDEKEFKSYMDDHALIRELKKYKATPKVILENKELLTFFLPSIRKDYELNESLQYHQEIIDIPIVAYAGRADEGANKEIMKGWKQMTRQGFEVKEFDGDHFFIAPEKEIYFETLVKEINASFLRKN